MASCFLPFISRCTRNYFVIYFLFDSRRVFSTLARTIWESYLKRFFFNVNEPEKNECQPPYNTFVGHESATKISNSVPFFHF